MDTEHIVSVRYDFSGMIAVRVLDAALAKIQEILIRMEGIARRAADEACGDEERVTLNAEFERSKEEIDRIAKAHGIE